jgi:hypothetical protein
MAHRIFAVGCLSLLAVLGVPLASGKEPKRDRRAFAQAMSKINEGMSESEVLARVGTPDDVMTQKDPHFGLGDVREIWRYGVAGHMQVATLGQICISQQHRVKYVFGQGAPPPEGMFTEAELKQLFEALYDLSIRDGQYNPRTVIRAVNMLQPLGKDKALAAVIEFVRVSSDDTEYDAWECLSLVLRTLFEVPTVPTVFDDDITPTPAGIMAANDSWLVKSADPKLLPRFPVSIEGDIPFLVPIGARGSTGPGPQPLLHVAYFQKYGTLRAKPLVPTNNPIAATEEFINSNRWCYQEKAPNSAGERIWAAMDLRNQALRLLDTVHRFEPDEFGEFLKQSGSYPPESPKVCEARNNELMAQAMKFHVRWDPAASRYTRLDGTFEPPFDRRRHPALTWRPAALQQFGLGIVVERENRWYLELDNWQDEDFAEKREVAPYQGMRVFKIFDVKLKHKPIEEIIELPAGNQVRLEEGHRIELELTVGNKTERSPVFEP